MGPDPAPKSRPIDPVFRTDSVVLAISAEKDGNLRVVYARIGRCQGRPAWRGAQAAVARPCPAVTCHGFGRPHPATIAWYTGGLVGGVFNDDVAGGPVSLLEVRGEAVETRKKARARA